MKKPRRSSGPQRLLDEFQAARVRLARAEARWKTADDQAQAARRRRKEAKRLARRARKLAKHAEREFAEAKEMLAAAEEKFTSAVERAARNRKLAQARLAARTVTARKKLKRTRPSHARRSAARSIPKSRKPIAHVMAVVKKTRRMRAAPRPESASHQTAPPSGNVSDSHTITSISNPEVQP